MTPRFLLVPVVSFVAWSGDLTLLGGGDLGGLSDCRFCSGLRSIVDNNASSEKSEPLPWGIDRPAVLAFLLIFKASVIVQ